MTRGPARHARVRQGDDGGSRPAAGDGQRAEGEGRRQGVAGLDDPAARRRSARRDGAGPEPRRPPRRPPRRRPTRRRPARAGRAPRPTRRVHAGRCSAPGPAATPRRSGPPTSARRWCWSSATSARRRLPERRLHSVEGAAARRARDRRRRGDEAHPASLRRARTIDLDGLRKWKERWSGKLTGGLAGLAKGARCTVVARRGQFAGPHVLTVETDDGDKTVALRPLHHRRRLESAPGFPISRTTSASWTRPARSSSPTSPSGCSSSAAASSGSRWPRCTTRSARR